MTRVLLLLLLVVAAPYAWAGEFTIRLAAPGYEGQMVVLSRYDDLITMRPVRMAEEPADANVVLTGEVEGTQKMQLRIGDLIGDLYVRPGSDLQVLFPQPDPRMQRSLSSISRVSLEFTEISPFDINALVTDLNERMDDFVAEDLATDEAAGMQALDIQRRSGEAVDTTKRPPTLFVNPVWSAARVDTFAMKLQRFYAEVDDPWFKEYLEYSVAGLMQGPRVKDRMLYDRYLKGRPVLHDNTEYVRFVRSFFEGQLGQLAHMHAARFNAAMATGNTDSLHAVLRSNDFLYEEPELRELVLIEQLYTSINHQFVQRKAAEKMLAEVAENSTVEAHRKIAANMLWDLTAMRVGSTLPAMMLQDLQGNSVEMAELMEGPLVIAVSASWCTYCQVEIAALEGLAKEYEGVIPIVGISLDESLDDVKRYVVSRPHRLIRWLHAEAEQRLRDDLRIRSLPAFYFLQDGVLTHSPGPLPSAGMAEILHKAKVQKEKEGQIKFWDD